MRGITKRLLSSACLFALFVSLSLWSGHTLRGQPDIPIGGQPGKKGGKDEKKDDRSVLDENMAFLVPYERDAKNQLKAARDYLEFKDPPYNTICPLLQNILDSRSDSFFEVKYKVGERTLINRISVKTEANRIIAAFNKEGLQFYQQAYGVAAATQLEEAVKANYDIPTLADVSQRYFHTKAGAEATILIGTIYLERGNYLEAAYAFERLLTRQDIDDLMTPRTLFKAMLAFKRSGDTRHAELFKTEQEKLFKVVKDGIKIGRTTYTAEKIRAELDRPVQLMQSTSLVGEWTTRGGNPSRSAVVNGGSPFLDKTFSFPMFYSGDDEANLWIKGELDKLFSRDSKAPKSLPLPAFFPVTTSDLIMFRSYDGVYGVATRDRVVGGRVVRAGDIMWRSKTTAGLHQLISSDGTTNDVDMHRDAKNWWATYNTREVNVNSILYENSLIGSLSHDGQSVYFVDDIAITPPPVFSDPNMGIMGGPQFRQSGELADMVRAGRLAAVDMKTGSLKWELGRVKVTDPEPNAKGPQPPPLPARLNEEEADKTTDAFRLCLDAVFLGAPLHMNGRLYVLIEQGGIIRLLCLDPRNLVKAQGPDPTPKPTLVWSQKLGRPSSILPQDSVRRFQGVTLAASDGIIICPTNSGAIVAVDSMSRSLLWAHGYRPVVEPKREIDPNTGRLRIPQQLPNDRWRSAGPIISNGRVILTAYDSPKLECLDLRTGKVLWSVSRDPNDLYIGGVYNDRVVVVGKNQIRAYHLTGEDKELRPKVAWEPITIPTPTGHGAIGRNTYYVPVRQETAGRDTTPAAEIWAINIETGKIVAKPAARKRNDTAELAKFGIGNLVFQDGMVYSQSPWEIAAYPQLELKIAEMNRLLEKNPKDPLGLLARGELSLDDGKLKEAVADFKEAEKNNLPIEKRPLLREKLYIAYTELLRADFAAAEGFLKEYETLCEVPEGAMETPEDKVRREDETKRRKRLHYYLLARGRESQGRLSEAFDHYLSLANLGEGKQLLEMPDEPNVRMRPDVWARGRIESMIRRAATPEAKKSLEDRVNKEWDAVKDGRDLKRLREFVSVFGSFFASGADAQFKLADVLLSTNNEADMREAQTHLSQLRVTADDPAIRARATEALAQLMIKNRMMEDAVGLYMQLGKEYPNVVIRDGKTGADYLTNLLTDKRLLPFLEPSRFPLPSRVKAEVTPLPPGTNFNTTMELESPAELFPMFKQWRFAINLNIAGNGSWVVQGFDRSTGNERFRSPNLANPNLYSNNGQPIPYSKFVQGNGHLMTVQLGAMVYCFDLVEKKELWSKNLLPDGALQPGMSYSVQVMPDGECMIMFPNGTNMVLGRSVVLQSNYAALLTSDELEVIEPQTRRVLWVRKGIAERTRIYGDARFIVLVEMDAQRKPVATKLLRAVDGLVVENSPDCGRALSEATSFRIMGNKALLTSGTGDQPRVLRLHDLSTGKDVWKKEYDAKSVVISSPLNSEWSGFVKPDGKAEVFSVRTGETVAKLEIDEKNVEAHMKGCVAAQVLADNDRFYLILDRDPNAAGPNGTRPLQVYNQFGLRTQKVNGPLYAFDRVTNKRLWYYADLFEHQLMVLDQFTELPVIIANSPMMGPNNNAIHPFVVIEKERGRLIMERNVVYNGNPFQSMTIDQKNGTISVNRYDTRIYITPDEAKKNEKK